MIAGGIQVLIVKLDLSSYSQTLLNIFWHRQYDDNHERRRTLANSGSCEERKFLIVDYLRSNIAYKSTSLSVSFLIIRAGYRGVRVSVFFYSKVAFLSSLLTKSAEICSGQPKGLSSGFRPKFSVSVGAETFWQNFPFGRKSSFGFRAKLRILDCPLSVSAETLSVDH